ncbi:hypothetical protein SAMN04488601_1011798 [Paenibacillus sp. 453mf]|nr:hypothetical protein SAMN04488601_1011798 [Paenibacillus sp. 453mf]
MKTEAILYYLIKYILYPVTLGFVGSQLGL